MFYYKGKFSVLFKAIAIAVVCAFLANDIAFAADIRNSASTFALAAPSRFGPISLKWDSINEKYTITLDGELREDTKELVKLKYLSVLIRQFLREVATLSKAGLSSRGLNRQLEDFKDKHLELFMAGIEEKFPHASKKFGRFRFNEMRWEGNVLCLPYEDKSAVKILRYAAESADNLAFDRQIEKDARVQVAQKPVPLKKLSMDPVIHMSAAGAADEEKQTGRGAKADETTPAPQQPVAQAASAITPPQEPAPGAASNKAPLADSAKSWSIRKLDHRTYKYLIYQCLRDVFFSCSYVTIVILLSSVCGEFFFPGRPEVSIESFTLLWGAITLAFLVRLSVRNKIFKIEAREIILTDGRGNVFIYQGPAYFEHGGKKNGIHVLGGLWRNPAASTVNKLAAKEGIDGLLLTGCNRGHGKIGPVGIPCIHAASLVRWPLFNRLLPSLSGFFEGAVYYSRKGWWLVLPSGEEIELGEAIDRGLIPGEGATTAAVPPAEPESESSSGGVYTNIFGGVDFVELSNRFIRWVKAKIGGSHYVRKWKAEGGVEYFYLQNGLRPMTLLAPSLKEVSQRRWLRPLNEEEYSADQPQFVIESLLLQKESPAGHTILGALAGVGAERPSLGAMANIPHGILEILENGPMGREDLIARFTGSIEREQIEAKLKELIDSGEVVEEDGLLKPGSVAPATKPKKARGLQIILPIRLALAGKERLQDLNIPAAAEIIGMKEQALRYHLKNHPEDYEKYGIRKTVFIPQLVHTFGKAKLDGLSITRAAKLMGVNSNDLSHYFREHRDVQIAYGVVDGRKGREYPDRDRRIAEIDALIRQAGEGVLTAKEIAGLLGKAYRETFDFLMNTGLIERTKRPHKRDVSASKARRDFGALLRKEGEFNPEELRAKAEALKGKVLGKTYPQGVICINVYPKYQGYFLHIITDRKDKGGWTVKIEDIVVHENICDIHMLLTKGKRTIRQTYQIGHYSRELKPESKSKVPFEKKEFWVLEEDAAAGAIYDLITAPALFHSLVLANKIPDLRNLRFGPLRQNSGTKLFARGFYQVIFYLLGFKDNGWDAVIKRHWIDNDILNIDIELTKGEKTFTRLFQISPYVTETIWPTALKEGLGPKTVLAFDPALADRALADLLARAPETDWERCEEEISHLTGLRFRKTNILGNIKLRFKRPGYLPRLIRGKKSHLYAQWKILSSVNPGRGARGWAPEIKDARIISKDFFEFTVLYRKGKRTFSRIFQVGRCQRKFREIKGKEASIKAWWSDRRMGAKILGQLILLLGAEDQKGASELPSLLGLRLGKTVSRGHLGITVASGYRRCNLPALGRMMGDDKTGWNGVVVREEMLPHGHRRFVIRLEKRGETPILATFQTGGEYSLPRKDSGKASGYMKISGLISVDTVTSLADVGGAQARRSGREPRANRAQAVSPYSGPVSNAIFDEMLKAVAESKISMSSGERNIADAIIAGNDDETIASDLGVASGQIEAVKQKLQMSLRAWEPSQENENLGDGSKGATPGILGALAGVGGGAASFGFAQDAVPSFCRGTAWLLGPTAAAAILASGIYIWLGSQKDAIIGWLAKQGDRYKWLSSTCNILARVLDRILIPVPAYALAILPALSGAPVAMVIPPDIGELEEEPDEPPARISADFALAHSILEPQAKAIFDHFIDPLSGSGIGVPQEGEVEFFGEKEPDYFVKAWSILIAPHEAVIMDSQRQVVARINTTTPDKEEKTFANLKFLMGEEELSFGDFVTWALNTYRQKLKLGDLWQLFGHRKIDAADMLNFASRYAEPAIVIAHSGKDTALMRNKIAVSLAFLRTLDGRMGVRYTLGLKDYARIFRVLGEKIDASNVTALDIHGHPMNYADETIASRLRASEEDLAIDTKLLKSNEYSGAKQNRYIGSGIAAHMNENTLALRFNIVDVRSEPNVMWHQDYFISRNPDTGMVKLIKDGKISRYDSGDDGFYGGEIGVDPNKPKPAAPPTRRPQKKDDKKSGRGDKAGKDGTSAKKPAFAGVEDYERPSLGAQTNIPDSILNILAEAGRPISREELFVQFTGRILPEQIAAVLHDPIEAGDVIEENGLLRLAPAATPPQKGLATRPMMLAIPAYFALLKLNEIVPAYFNIMKDFVEKAFGNFLAFVNQYGRFNGAEAQRSISNSWRPTNLSRGTSCSISRQSIIVSLILLSSVGIVFACVWPHFSDVAVAINMPSSSFSITIGNSYLRILNLLTNIYSLLQPISQGDKAFLFIPVIAMAFGKWLGPDKDKPSPTPAATLYHSVPIGTSGTGQAPQDTAKGGKRPSATSAADDEKQAGRGSGADETTTAPQLPVAGQAPPAAEAAEGGEATREPLPEISRIEALLNSISQENLSEQELSQMSITLSQAVKAIHSDVDMDLDINKQEGNVRMMVGSKPYETYAVSTPDWRRRNDIIFSRSGTGGAYMTAIPTGAAYGLSLIMSSLALDVKRISVTPIENTDRVMIQIRFFGTESAPRIITAMPRISDTKALVTILTVGIALANADVLYKWHYEQDPEDIGPVHSADGLLERLDGHGRDEEAIVALKTMCREDAGVAQYLLKDIPYTRLPRTMKNAGLPALAGLLLDYFKDGEKWRMPTSWLEHIAPQIRRDTARLNFESYVITLFDEAPIIPAETIKFMRSLIEREIKEWSRPDGENPLALAVDNFFTVLPHLLPAEAEQRAQAMEALQEMYQDETLPKQVRDYAFTVWAMAADKQAAPDAGNAQKWEQLEDFFRRHPYSSRPLPSGAIYVPTPIGALEAIFDEYKTRLAGNEDSGQPLAGKRYFSLGSGGMHDALAAAYIYDMQVVAVEQDNGLSDYSQRILEDAVKEGLIREGQVKFYPNQNAFDLKDWEDPDIVYFFYTLPPAMHKPQADRADTFERPLLEKVRNLKKGSLVAFLFTASQRIAGYDKFDIIGKRSAEHALLPLDTGIQVSRVMGGLYLDIYSPAAPGADRADAEAESPRPAIEGLPGKGDDVMTMGGKEAEGRVQLLDIHYDEDGNLRLALNAGDDIDVYGVMFKQGIILDLEKIYQIFESSHPAIFHRLCAISMTRRYKDAGRRLTYEQMSRRLGDFVYCHEIFHRMMRTVRRYIRLKMWREDTLASIFALNALGVELNYWERHMLEAFVKKVRKNIRDPRLRDAMLAQLKIPYTADAPPQDGSPDFFYNLHRNLGVDATFVYKGRFVKPGKLAAKAKPVKAATFASQETPEFAGAAPRGPSPDTRRDSPAGAEPGQSAEDEAKAIGPSTDDNGVSGGVISRRKFLGLGLAALGLGQVGLGGQQIKPLQTNPSYEDLVNQVITDKETIEGPLTVAESITADIAEDKKTQQDMVNLLHGYVAAYNAGLLDRAFVRIENSWDILDCQQAVIKRGLRLGKRFEFTEGLLYHGGADLDKVLLANRAEGELFLTRAGHEWATGFFTKRSKSPAIFVLDTKYFNSLQKSKHAEFIGIDKTRPGLRHFDPYPKSSFFSLDEVKEIWVSEETFDRYKKIANAAKPSDLAPEDRPLIAVQAKLRTLLENGKIKKIPGLRHTELPCGTKEERIISYAKVHGIVGKYMENRGLFQYIPFFKIEGEDNPFADIDRKALASPKSDWFKIVMWRVIPITYAALLFLYCVIRYLIFRLGKRTNLQSKFLVKGAILPEDTPLPAAKPAAEAATEDGIAAESESGEGVPATDIAERIEFFYKHTIGGRLHCITINVSSRPGKMLSKTQEDIIHRIIQIRSDIVTSAEYQCSIREAQDNPEALKRLIARILFLKGEIFSLIGGLTEELKGWPLAEKALGDLQVETELFYDSVEKWAATANLSRATSSSTSISPDEFEERLAKLYELNERYVHKGSVHCQGRDYKYTMSDTDLDRYTWHFGPAYFRAGDIFVINAGVSPKPAENKWKDSGIAYWNLPEYRQEQKRIDDEKQKALEELLKLYPKVVMLYEEQSDSREGGWLPYTYRENITGAPYYLSHTIGLLISMQVNQDAIKGHTFIDAFSRNGLMANAAYLLGASDAVVIENDYQEVLRDFLKINGKPIKLPESTDLIRANLMINGNLDTSRIYYMTLRAVPEKTFKDAVLAFSAEDFGFDYQEKSQTELANLRRKAPDAYSEWVGWREDTPEGQAAMSSKRESILRDIHETFAGISWIIASGGTESSELADWGITQKLIREAESMECRLHSIFEIRQTSDEFDDMEMTKHQNILIMPTLTFIDLRNTSVIQDGATPDISNDEPDRTSTADAAGSAGKDDTASAAAPDDLRRRGSSAGAEPGQKAENEAKIEPSQEAADMPVEQKLQKVMSLRRRAHFMDYDFDSMLTCSPKDYIDILHATIFALSIRGVSRQDIDNAIAHLTAGERARYEKSENAKQNYEKLREGLNDENERIIQIEPATLNYPAGLHIRPGSFIAKLLLVLQDLDIDAWIFTKDLAHSMTAGFSSMMIPDKTELLIHLSVFNNKHDQEQLRLAAKILKDYLEDSRIAEEIEQAIWRSQDKKIRIEAEEPGTVRAEYFSKLRAVFGIKDNVADAASGMGKIGENRGEGGEIREDKGGAAPPAESRRGSTAGAKPGQEAGGLFPDTPHTSVPTQPVIKLSEKEISTHMNKDIRANIQAIADKLESIKDHIKQRGFLGGVDTGLGYYVAHDTTHRSREMLRSLDIPESAVSSSGRRKYLRDVFNEYPSEFHEAIDTLRFVIQKIHQGQPIVEKELSPRYRMGSGIYAGALATPPAPFLSDIESLLSNFLVISAQLDALAEKMRAMVIASKAAEALYHSPKLIDDSGTGQAAEDGAKAIGPVTESPAAKLSGNDVAAIESILEKITKIKDDLLYNIANPSSQFPASEKDRDALKRDGDLLRTYRFIHHSLGSIIDSMANDYKVRISDTRRSLLLIIQIIEDVVETLERGKVYASVRDDIRSQVMHDLFCGEFANTIIKASANNEELSKTHISGFRYIQDELHQILILLDQIEDDVIIGKVMDLSDAEKSKGWEIGKNKGEGGRASQSGETALPPGAVRIETTCPPRADIREKLIPDLERERNVAADFWDELITRASAAKKKGEFIILGLEESWIPDKSGPQGMIAELKRIPKRLKQLGFDNVIFKNGRGDAVAITILKARENRETKIPLRNIMVLGSRSILASGEFKKLRSYKPRDSATLVGVEPKNLGITSGVRLLEMCLLLMRLNAAKLPEDESDPEYQEKVKDAYERIIAALDTEFIKIGVDLNDGFWDFIFTPIKPYDVEQMRVIDRLYIDEIKSKA